MRYLPSIEFGAALAAICAVAVIALGTLPDLTMIMAQFGGQPAIRINSGADAMTDTGAYGELHSFAVDASGHWLAALSANAPVGGAQLWFGPVDGDLDVAAIDVPGFAWHDSVPASLTNGAPTGDSLGRRDICRPFRPKGLQLARPAVRCLVSA